MGKCKPCIFDVVRDNIGWKSDGKKYPYFMESMGINFPGSLNSMDFAVFSNGKLMGKPKHFPCDEVYYRMGIWLEKYTHTMEKVWVWISQAFPWLLLHFTVPWEINGETHAFFIWWGIPQNWNLMEKAPILWKKYGNLFPKLCPFDGFCWIFPYYWKLIRKPIHFPCNEEYHRMGI